MDIRPYKILEKSIITSGTGDSFPIVSYKIQPLQGEIFNFLPGQFITIFSDDKKIFRSYSIASSPDSDYLELLIEMVHGKLTSYLEKEEVGDILNIGEPRGNFVLTNYSKLTFLAAGVGIAPFLSMLRYIKAKNITPDVYLFYSVKHTSDIVYREELALFQGLGVKIFINVTRDMNIDQEFIKGRININELKEKIYDFREREYFLCGGLNFVRDIRQNLINSGIDSAKIKSDIWGESYNY